MPFAVPQNLLQQAGRYELSLCAYVNRACHRPGIEKFFATVSRLGDGPVWYALMLLIPIYHGRQGLAVSGAMAATALFGVICYKFLKWGTERPRPYTADQRIKLGAAPLDRFSFPSGHTLHAVAFSTIAVSQYPELALVLVPFTLLVAFSRVILGLHYPSDVLAGAGLGLLFSSLCLRWI